MRWGTPKEYAALWKDSGEQYRNQLLFWLQFEKPDLYELVKKEIRHDTPSHTHGETPQGKKQKTEKPGIPPTVEHEDPIQELGDDLLARGD